MVRHGIRLKRAKKNRTSTKSHKSSSSSNRKSPSKSVSGVGGMYPSQMHANIQFLLASFFTESSLFYSYGNSNVVILKALPLYHNFNYKIA